MSEVSICNQALGWVGADPIISLDDPTKAAALCKTNYAPLRDAVLEAHNWTFAIGRYALAQAAPPPAFGFRYAYALPSEVLRVIHVNKVEEEDPTRQWQIENINGKRSIVTDDDQCKLKGVIRVSDTLLFTPLFTQALAARLAMDLAIPIASSRSLMESMADMYLAKLQKASAMDGTQGKSKRLRSRWLNRSRHATLGTAGPTV